MQHLHRHLLLLALSSAGMSVMAPVAYAQGTTSAPVQVGQVSKKTKTSQAKKKGLFVRSSG